VEGRGQMGRKRGGKDKGKERELGRVLWSPKILKIGHR